MDVDVAPRTQNLIRHSPERGRPLVRRWQGVKPAHMPTQPLSVQDLEHVLGHTRGLWPELRGSRLFVTGGTGFFGHWLLESLLYANRELSLGIRATVLTRNADAFRERSPHIALDPAIALLEGDVRSFHFPADVHTHIVHAATDSGGQQTGRPEYELAESILEGTRRTLRFALETGARRLLYVSTGAVYGRSSATESHVAETSTAGPDPLLLSSSYEEGKRMAEHLCVAYSEGTQLQTVIARPFAFVGPHLPLGAHFAIGNFVGAAIAGRPIHIRGDGTPVRSWLYMADLAVALWTLLMRAPANRAYNVGSEVAYSIAEAARLTAATLRPGLAIQIDGTPDPLAPLNSYVPSTARAREELGIRQTTSLEEGLRRTAAWYGYRVEGAGEPADGRGR